MMTRLGDVYRYRPRNRVGYWTLYQQLTDGLFFSGSSEVVSNIGEVYRGSNNEPGCSKDDRSWEVLI